MNVAEMTGQAYRAMSRYADYRAQVRYPVTEFIPPGCWVVTAARRLKIATFHRVDYGIAVWAEEDRPWFGAVAWCGERFGRAAFYDEVPDDHEWYCDACLMGDDRPIVVYRLFDAEGDLLYVGCTTDMVRRVVHHRMPSGSPWWPLVASYTMTEYPTHEEAFSAETVAIRTEAPRFNVGKGGRGSWPRLLAKRDAALEALVAA